MQSQAIPEIRKAEELDPTDQWISGLVSLVLFYARDYVGAIEQGRRTKDLNPNSNVNRAYEMKGDEQSAFAERLKQAESSGMAPEEIASMKAAFATGGWKGFVRYRLDRLLEQEKRRYVSPWEIALHHARLGEREQALARLQQAVDDRNFYATSLNVEPLWDSYRSDPRFVALVRRVGLAP